MSRRRAAVIVRPRTAVTEVTRAAIAAIAAIACGRRSEQAKPVPTNEPVASASAPPAPSTSRSTVASVPTDATRAKPQQCWLMDPEGLPIGRGVTGSLRGFSVAMGDERGSFASVLGSETYVYEVERTLHPDRPAFSLNGTEAAAVVIPRKGGVATIGRFADTPFGLREPNAAKAPTWPDATARRVFKIGAAGRGERWFAAGVVWELGCETDDDKCFAGVIPGPGRSTITLRKDARTSAQLALFFDDGHGTVAEPLETTTCDGVDCEGSRFRWEALSVAMDDANALVAWRDLGTIKVAARTLDGKPIGEAKEPMLVVGGSELSRPSVAAIGDTFWIVFSMRPKAGAPHAVYAASWKPGLAKPTFPKQVYAAPNGASANGVSIAARPDGTLALAWTEGDGKTAALRLATGATIDEALKAPTTLGDKRFPARDTTLAWGKAFGLVAWTEPSTGARAQLYDVGVRGARIECP
jgi:hypothetical protein